MAQRPAHRVSHGRVTAHNERTGPDQATCHRQKRHECGTNALKTKGFSGFAGFGRKGCYNLRVIDFEVSDFDQSLIAEKIIRGASFWSGIGCRDRRLNRRHLKNEGFDE
jgi:hypothetical protein